MAKNTEREWFIRQLAEGDSVFDPPQIDLLAEQLGVHFSGLPYFCLAVRYTHENTVTEDVARLLELKRICSDFVRKQKHQAWCYLGSRLCVVLVLPCKDVRRSETVEKLKNALARAIPHPIQIGVGRCYPQVEKLSYSRVESYEALSALTPSECVSYIDDLYVSRSFTTRKLESQRRKIIELFKSGQLDQMEEKMAQLAENVRSESPVRSDAPYPTSIRRTILEVLFEIMHISADAGVDVDKLMEYQDPYTRVFGIGGSTPALLEWLSDIARTLRSAISERQTRSQSNMLQMANDCIQTHLSDPELSLSLVSQALEITPTYFSAFFMRQMGMGFNEYVTGQRIELAKQLLSATNKKINQIAAECGFRSASYFIVVFRKQVGISPGEFRDKKMQ